MSSHSKEIPLPHWGRGRFSHRSRGSGPWAWPGLALLLVALLGACSAPPAAPTSKAANPASAASGTEAVEPTSPAAPAAPTLLLVTTETGGALDFVRRLAAEFSSQSTWRVEVVPKAAPEMRLDMQTAALADAAPDLIWTSADQARVLAAADVLQPAGDLVTPDAFVPAAVADGNLQGTQWGVPVSAGNQLVLLYNRGLIASPPATTDELLSMPRPAGAETLLAYDPRDPLWLSAWLDGFGGSLRGGDGRPSLNTPQMVQTLFFLKELRSREIVPPDVDAASAEALFREGRVAMLATHAWALASFAGPGAPGFEVGIAPLPRAAATGRAPAAGLPSAQLLIGKAIDDERRTAAGEFVAYVTGAEVQERLLAEARRLPALTSVLKGPAVQNDPELRALADAQGEVRPLASSDPLLEVVAPWLAEVLAGVRPPEEVVKEMQDAAMGGAEGG